MNVSIQARANRLAGRRTQAGSAVIVVIALLSIVLLYLAFNARTLQLLHRHVQFIETVQLRRLASTSAKTNGPPSARTTTNQVSTVVEIPRLAR